MAEARSAWAINPWGKTRVSNLQYGPRNKVSKIFIYYIDSSEIPGELLRRNMISSHVKITCYFHM